MSDLQDARDVALMVLMSKSKPSVDEVLAVLADLVEAARRVANLDLDEMRDLYIKEE